MAHSDYNSLQMLAFRMVPGLTQLPHPCALLKVPEHWKEALKRLQADSWKREYGQTTVPYNNLNKLLRALIPDLIAIESGAWKQGERPWLYAAEPINKQALYLVIRAWAEAAFERASEGEREAAVSQLQASDLMWIPVTTNLAQWEPAHTEHFFHLLPDYLAAKLSQDEVALHLGAEPLRFRRAPLAPGSCGAELFSWPPRWYERNGKKWPFSVLLTLSAQTVPFQDYPHLHCDIGIRRWAYASNTHPPGGEDTNVCLHTRLPWVEAMHYSPAFQVAPMRWRRATEAERMETGSDFRMTWSSSLAEVLNRLRPAHPLPDAHALCASPGDWLQQGDSLCAAIIYRNGMTPEHAVQAGITPADRHELALQVADLLQPELTFVEPLLRAETGSFTRSVNPFFTSKQTMEDETKYAVIRVARRKSLHRVVGEQVGFDVYFESSQIDQSVTDAIKEVCGMAVGDNFPYRCSETGMMIHLRTEPLGAMGGELDVPQTYGKSLQQGREKAFQRRKVEVAERVSPASFPTVAIVETYGRKGYKVNADPKEAIRQALAHIRRCSQFIETGYRGQSPEDVEKYTSILQQRARSSALDALRQLGVQTPLSYPSSLVGPVNCIGVWLIKEPILLPVMVLLDGSSGQVLARAGFMDSWRPYHEVLLMVGRGEVRSAKNFKMVPAIIKETLTRDLPSGDTLLLCHAQNLRSAWTWLSNKHLTRDALAFDLDEQPMPIAHWPGLRVIRVRDSDGHETPEGYTPTADDSVGYSRGLFRLSDYVFMGVNPKPPQFKGLSRNLSKLAAWEDSKGRSHSPSPTTYAWNAALCEFATVCLQEGDKPEVWAALANRLRFAATHYDPETALPLPLHLAMRVQEYIPSVTGDEGI